MFFLVLLDALIAYLRFIQSQWFCVLICAAWQLGENLHWNSKKGHQENHLFDEIWNIFNLTNSMNLFLKVWRLPIAIISLFEYTFYLRLIRGISQTCEGWKEQVKIDLASIIMPKHFKEKGLGKIKLIQITQWQKLG